MYMTEKQKQLLKRYIKKVLLENMLLESSYVETKEADDTNLTAVLQKGHNRPYPIGPQELEKIKEAINHVYHNISSVDFTNNTIQFEVNQPPTNFHFAIRKIANPANSNEYKYTMWYVPFTQREDIDKPGAVFSRSGSPFDKNANIPNFLSNIYNFFTDALLMNK